MKAFRVGSPALRAFLMEKNKEVEQVPRNRERQRENRRIYKRGGGISSKNAEGYTDKTASAAMRATMRKGVRK